jgi:hypothetical protein
MSRLSFWVRTSGVSPEASSHSSLSDCGRSTSEEVEEEHDYTDDQQDVNQTAGNMKGQESKQPKNNQNHGDNSKHVFNSFYL